MALLQLCFCFWEKPQNHWSLCIKFSFSKFFLRPSRKLREGNVFSRVGLSVCRGVPCDHYPWCIKPHFIGLPPPDMDVTGQGPPGSDVWWPSLETCSNLFTSGPSTHVDIWRILKHILLAQVGGTHPSGMLSWLMQWYYRSHLCNLHHNSWHIQFILKAYLEADYVNFKCTLWTFK